MNESLAGEAQAKRNFHTLDGLRGVAAILVVMLHYGPDLGFSPDNSNMAVDLFFGMSGIVLARAYEQRLRSTLSIRSFMLLRFTRLYPLFILGAAIAAVPHVVGLVLHLAVSMSWGEFAAMLVPALFLLPTVPGTAEKLYPLDFPGWSLFYELVANLVFAILIGVRRPAAVIGLLAMAGVGLIAVGSIWGSFRPGIAWGDAPVAIFRVMFFFPLGIVLHRLYIGGLLPRPRVPAAVLMLFVAVMMAFSPPTAWLFVYQVICLFVCIPVLLWLAICNEPRHGLRIYSVLGLISYPLYVIHVPIGYFFGRGVSFLFRNGHDSFVPWVGLVLIAILLPVSWVLAVSYDVWARQHLGRLFGRVVGRVP